MGIKACDPASFHTFTSSAYWEADQKCVYWNNKVVPEADASSFKVINASGAKDRNHLFVAGKVVPPDTHIPWGGCAIVALRWMCGGKY
jgi:hypothetical protein